MSDDRRDDQRGVEQGEPVGGQQGDDVRQRFKEALERKRVGHGTGTSDEGGRRGPSLHSSTGPAKQQRTFRRKSG